MFQEPYDWKKILPFWPSVTMKIKARANKAIFHILKKINKDAQQRI